PMSRQQAGRPANRQVQQTVKHTVCSEDLDATRPDIRGLRHAHTWSLSRNIRTSTGPIRVIPRLNKNCAQATLMPGSFEDRPSLSRTDEGRARAVLRQVC